MHYCTVLHKKGVILYENPSLTAKPRLSRSQHRKRDADFVLGTRPSKACFHEAWPPKQESINVENLASIRKSGTEIKNRCSRVVVTFCRRNHSSLRRRRIESDAADRCRNGWRRRAILLCSDCANHEAPAGMDIRKKWKFSCWDGRTYVNSLNLKSFAETTP